VKLSIIIINHNTCELLRTCLSSIYKQTQNIVFEVIVVDNGSTDGSREMLAQDFPQVVTIFNDENKGFAAANNQGIRQAKGESVLLLNSDTEILDRAIEKTISFMEQYPEASIAGCKLLNPDGTLQPSCRSFPSAWNLFAEATFLYLLFKKTELFGGYHKSDFSHTETRQVDVVMGAFMMIRREVFEKAGLLDESYFMYTEETDFCYRARQFGFKVYFTPEAQIIHHVAGSKKSTQSYHEHLHLSQLLFIRKHFAGFNKALCVFWKRFGLALRVPVYMLACLLRFDRNRLQKALIYASVLGMSFRRNSKVHPVHPPAP
jgi:GT2 family glycosyltransferase